MDVTQLFYAGTEVPSLNPSLPPLFPPPLTRIYVNDRVSALLNDVEVIARVACCYRQHASTLRAIYESLNEISMRQTFL